jgi:hypothetical protein
MTPALRASAFRTLLSPPRWAPALLLALAALWLLGALVAMANFALRYPAFDQYRLYSYYLGMDFPASALQLENGHRPILPALVRIAELHWGVPDQRLQTVLAVLLALGTLATVALTAWRGRRSALSAATMVLLATLGLFWLGYARMMMHGYEMLHVHLISLSVVLAVVCVQRAGRGRPVLPMALAGALALAATFSFGPGIACFAAVFVLAAAMRLPPRCLVIPLLLLGLALLAYLGGLPGEAGVRGSLALRPLDNLKAGLQWLASPFFHAWLGYAEPGMLGWNPGTRPEEKPLLESARALAAWLGPDWKARIGLLIGLAGVIGWAWQLFRAWRHPQALGGVGALALGLSSFGLAVGAIIALARLAYFDLHPGQLMADRYLPWPGLFWLGLALAIAERAAASAAPVWRAAAPVLAVALFLVLLPSHRGEVGWSAAVHRGNQQSAVAAQLGLWDAERFPREDDASRRDVETTLALLRERRLSMFAEPAYALWSEAWRAPPDTGPELPMARAFVTRRFHDETGNRPVAAFEGWLTRIEGRPRHPVLVVVDGNGEIRGLAKPSFIGPDKSPTRFNVPAKRGFDGYLIDPRPGEALQLLVLDPRTQAVLARVPVAHED